MPKKPQTVTASQIMNLVEEQNYRCALSGRELTPETASIDHVVPIARGGEHNLENLWVVDQQVNSAKGTMTLEEFLSVCNDVISHRRQEALTSA